MLGQDYSIEAVAVAGTPQMQPARPPPQPRVVESVAKARVRQQSASTQFSSPSAALERLSASARRFADLLDATGSLNVAATVSGFRAGQLDVYG